jgi:hypothetical protein
VLRENYILNQRIVQMGDHFQISLSPKVFRNMLTLPDPMPTFKGENCKQFLKKHGNELDLLPKLLQDPTPAPRDMAILQISACKNLFRQIAFHFHEDNETSKCNRHLLDDSVYFIFYGQATNHLPLPQVDFHSKLFPVIAIQEAEEILYATLFNFRRVELLSISWTIYV